MSDIREEIAEKIQVRHNTPLPDMWLADEIIAKVLADYPPYNKGFEEGYNTGFNDGCKSERAKTIERVLATVDKHVKQVITKDQVKELIKLEEILK